MNGRETGATAAPTPATPRRRRVAGLFLTPGAGASADHSSLLAIAEAASALGIAVERMDFPYRLAGRRRPDPAATLERSVREGVGRFAEGLGVETGSVVLGGRSMGGRICSQVVAQGLDAAGLALLSYPLHPPGHPDRGRSAHFPELGVPCLFVSGTRDAFGTTEELRTATRAIPGSVTHVWVEGGDHGLCKKDAEVAEAVVSWLRSTFVIPRRSR